MAAGAAEQTHCLAVWRQALAALPTCGLAPLWPSQSVCAVPAVVYAVGRLLRLSMSNLRTRIMYEDLPNTKRLVALCEDIYIARAEGELLLEGELYFAMISIYRSPQVLFELTKKKEA